MSEINFTGGGGNDESIGRNQSMVVTFDLMFKRCPTDQKKMPWVEKYQQKHNVFKVSN